MTQTASSPILRAIRRVVESPHLGNASDSDLLERFIQRRDESAFHALLRRHGPMVLDVCRAVVPNEADAEDAFQATFLVFTRNARRVRNPASLACWLHGVAYRTALKAKAEFAKRHKHESRAPARTSGMSPEPSWREVQAILHEELRNLAERHRAALVLYYLEGKTQDEAAMQLGLAKGTLKGRLERGRALLRQRLVRRGLGPAAVLLASAWPASAPAAVPGPVLTATVNAASLFAGGQALPPGVISAQSATWPREKAWLLPVPWA